MFETIVLAIDGSDHAQKALSVACNLARTYAADLYIVHVPEPGTQDGGRQVIDAAVATAGELGCTPADAIIGAEDVATSVLRVAQMTGADLIVMGRRGLGAVAGLVLGSVSQSIAQQAQCSCLTVQA